MVEFRVLGSLELRRFNGQAIPEILSHPKLVAILAYLAAAQPSGFHRRDKLLALFWPEQDEPHARHALNQSLYALRQALGGPVVISRGPEEVGLDWSDLHCDVAAFRDALAAGRPEAAMEQYRGELLDGFHVSGVPEFERWLDRERAALRDLALQAARGLSQRDDVEGPASALRWAWEACALAPYDEAAFRRLAELLDRSGDRARVLKEYEALVARLARDLEAEPSPETQALIAGIRRRERVHEAPAKEREASKAGTAEDATDAEAVVDAGAAGTVVDAGGVEAVVDAGAAEAVVDAGATGAAVDAGATVPGESERTAPGAAPKRRTGRRHLALKLGGSLVLALVVVGLWLRVSGYPLPVLGGPRSLVAAGFLEPRDTVILADVDPANADTVLAEAITEALRIDLARSRMVTLLGPGREADALARMERPAGEPLTAELARELAIRDGLKAVIDGRITAVGTSYVITARVVEPESGEILAAFRETADDSTGVLRALDRLSVALRARLGESLRSVRRGQSLSRVTTASLPALRKYTMALRASAEFDQDRAIGLLEEAIALDTAFAMAYRKLGVALLSRGIQTPRARWALEQALAHQDRLSDVERYLVLGTYHGLVGDDAEAIAAYRNLLRLRPGDATALNNLGAVYLGAGDYARAESAYLAATAPGHVPLAYLGAATAQVEQGELDDAAATVRRMLDVFPGNVAGLDYVARLAALRGDFAASDSVYATMEGAPGWRVSTYFYRGMNAGTQGRITAAKQWVDRALGEIRYPNYRVWNRTLRAYFDLEVLGRVAPAVRTVDDVVAITPSDAFAQEPGIYITLSVFYALAGDPARARELLAGLRAVVDTMPDADTSSAVDAANGFIALAENRPPAAIRWFREAQAHDPQPGRFQAFLGRAFELDHQPDSAIAAYTRYVEAPWLGRDGHDFLLPTDPYMLAQVHERLAQLLDARGDERAAVRHYARFVELWQAADPELQPRVEAARRRLDELRRTLAPGG
jgi:DNA-binding SARP family transcriptional activator/Tfp pilus assembly protein PilF